MSDKNSKTVVKENEASQAPAEEETKPADTPLEDTIPMAIQSSEPEYESLAYMGTDETSVTQITIQAPEAEDDEDLKMVEEWIGKTKKTKKGQKGDAEHMVSTGVELIRCISSNANRDINFAYQEFAERAISIGQICVRLKELIRGHEKPWGAWAEENLPFIAKRNREKYMLLASRPDCWPFSFLGVDRLEMLCSVTKAMEGEDRIGDLFKKYEIPFDDDCEINMTEFKSMIDSAINNERLVKSGLTINFSLVTNIINLGVDFDKPMIKRLKDIRDCGGNPETLLEKISLTGGKEDMDVTPEKRLQDFNHLTNRLIKTIDFMIGDQDQLVKIDKETFSLLLEKLVSIQDMGVLNTDGKKEA